MVGRISPFFLHILYSHIHFSNLYTTKSSTFVVVVQELEQANLSFLSIICSIHSYFTTYCIV